MATGKKHIGTDVRMKGIIALLSLLLLLSFVPPRKAELFFMDAKGKPAFSLKPNDFEIWRGLGKLALRIEKTKLDEISKQDDNLINGVCHVVNFKGDTISVRIENVSSAYLLDYCAHLFADRNGLMMVGENLLVIGHLHDGCGDRVENLGAFILGE